MTVEEFGSSIRCYGMPLLAAVEHKAKARGAVNAHERVGIVPMAARAMAPFDHDDIGVTLGDERIGKHARDPVSFLSFRLR